MKPISTKPANNVQGTLIRTDGTYMFRVYSLNGTFTDYHIDHSDLTVTITDPDSTFYHFDGYSTLDHSPETLGIVD